MLNLPTVILHHVLPHGEHYDWLFAHPGGGRSLVSFRVNRAPWRWSDGGALILTPLADHRWAYLRYEGAVSRGRGVVRRVDSGRCVVEQFAVSRIVVSLSTRYLHNRWIFNRQAPDCWRGVCSAAAGS